MPSVTYAEALEVALCFGWVGGQRAADDGRGTRQRFAPRTARSRWSQADRDAACGLQEQGRLRRAGCARWRPPRPTAAGTAAYAPPSTVEVPDDLRAALDAVPAAAAAFAGLDDRNR